MDEKSLAKQVLKMLGKGLPGVDVESVVKAGEQLRPHGTVYQLMAALVAAGALTREASSADLNALLDYLTLYNSSPYVSMVCCS